MGSRKHLTMKGQHPEDEASNIHIKKRAMPRNTLQRQSMISDFIELTILIMISALGDYKAEAYQI